MFKVVNDSGDTLETFETFDDAYLYKNMLEEAEEEDLADGLRHTFLTNYYIIDD